MNKKYIREVVTLAVNNVLIEGCSDVSVFSNQFEIKLLNEPELKEKIISDVSKSLLKLINENGSFSSLKFQKITYMLVPKKNFYDFRKCALIDVIDEIKYLSLVLLLVKGIETKRLKKDVVFSYRYKKYSNGRIFDKELNYSSFKYEYRRLTNMRKHKIIIECDINNFYDRLNIHRLNSTLLSIGELNSKVIETVDELLLFWADRNSYGIPVGSNASRILAEAFLIEIDNFLISNGIRFCRFVDDYRFFAENISEANKILSIFVGILDKHALSINLSKTKMRDISENNDKIVKQNKITREGLSEIIRGYSGIVPTKFRKLSESEIKNYSKEDERELKVLLEKSSIILPEDIIKYLKILISKQQYSKLKEIPDILLKFPQLVPYYSDLLLKNKEFISSKERSIILKKFELWLSDTNTLEYILISIVNLYNSDIDEEKNYLFNTFKNLKRNSGIYVGRVILEKLYNNLTRGDILELKDYYKRADIWEKRKIVDITLNGLCIGENRPFIKDLRINNEDEFINQLITHYLEKIDKNRK